MASNALKKITTRAKQIRKAHPSMSWKSAVKKAGAEYRSGAKPAARKKTARKSSSGAKRKTRTVSGVAPVIAGGHTMAGLRSSALKLLESKYGQLAVKKMKATGVRIKKQIAKEMAAVMKQIRLFSKA